MPELTDQEKMERIDALLSHVWMVRTFLKHSEEAEEDESFREVHRELYDYMLAVGAAWKAGDTEAYLKLASKKFSKLRKITATFRRDQPNISSHTNFQMAARSLTTAVDEIARILGQGDTTEAPAP